jgi:hypothetical protein
MNQPHQFKHRDVVRAFRAAEAAGVQNPTVQVQLPNGTTIVIGGAGGKPDAAASAISKVRQPSMKAGQTGKGR